ncbi:hypothetical protein [Acetobacterium wieringae]|uniref:hypothetical protein n=1 Tax=Acetobacterium wieringae TaxID=52694 RepID=UPI002B20B4BA|nr:hypothetical protein [Acetobacterium wieringae]
MGKAQAKHLGFSLQQTSEVPHKTAAVPSQLSYTLIPNPQTTDIDRAAGGAG